MNRKAALALLAVTLLVAIPMTNLVSAAAAVSPGTTDTFLGMPIVESFTGLEPSDQYSLEEDGTAIHTDLECDTDGKLSLTLSPSELGQIKYQLKNNASAVVLTFYLNNQDVMPYLMPIIYLVVIMSVVGAIKSGLRF